MSNLYLGYNVHRRTAHQHRIKRSRIRINLGLHGDTKSLGSGYTAYNIAMNIVSSSVEGYSLLRILYLEKADIFIAFI